MQADVRKVESMEIKIKTLEQTVESLSSKIDSNEQYERRDTLIMSGSISPVNNDENCTNIVRQLMQERNFILNPSDISTAHRIGKKPPPNHEDRRNIIFKLTRRDLKQEIINACKQRDPKIYINESLTPTRNAISFVLRKLKRQNRDSMGGVKSFDGNVYVWMPIDDGATEKKFRRVTVNTKIQLDDFLHKYFKVNSDQFITTWP